LYPWNEVGRRLGAPATAEVAEATDVSGFGVLNGNSVAYLLEHCLELNVWTAQLREARRRTVRDEAIDKGCWDPALAALKRRGQLRNVSHILAMKVAERWSVCQACGCWRHGAGARSTDPNASGHRRHRRAPAAVGDAAARRQSWTSHRDS
jgi:hypothetical protein